MVNKYLWILMGCLCLTGCEPSYQEKENEAKANVERLEARQTKLSNIVQKYEAQREAAHEEIMRLRALKGGLEDPGTNAPVVPTNQIVIVTNQIVVVTNQIVTVTQQVSSFDTGGDGRVSDKMLMVRHFNSSDVFSLPYSPHEFIVKSNGVVFYACKESSVGNTTNVYSFRIFHD